MASDVALAAALADDLDSAFEALVCGWSQRLYAFSLRMTGRSRDAEELAEETLVQAWRALAGYDAERRRALRVRPWLFQIAANLARNRARSARRNPVISLDAGDDADGQNFAAAAERIADADPLGAPGAALERQERLDELAALLLTLPEAQRVVVILRHIEGMQYAAIAEVVGEPVGTVKSHASRGVARLRKTLEHERVAAAQEALS
ncbi:MAG TPA: sigma-70 family RNA polymerase sigma factor [Ktedonobacterales bacterium]